jgi:hypothetical protein
MQRPKTKASSLALQERFGRQLQVRVSLDHHTQALHEAERGPRGWVKTVAGLDWLNGNGFSLAIAADLRAGERERRTCGLRRLIKERGWRIDAANPCELALSPNARRARRA